MEMIDIVKRCKQGDRKAWNMIVEKYSKTVFNIALSFAKTRDDASDITQDIFIKVFRNIDHFADDGNFSSWVIRISKNYCIDYWRKNKKYQDQLELDDRLRVHDSDSPEEVTVRDSESQLLREKLKLLDGDLCLLITMRDIQGFSYQEISESLNLPLGTVKSRINRGRIKLANLFFNGEGKNGM